MKTSSFVISALFGTSQAVQLGHHHHHGHQYVQFAEGINNINELSQTKDVSSHEPAREVGLPICNGLNGLDGRECRHDGPLPKCDGQFTGHRGHDCAVAQLSAPSVTVDAHQPSHEVGWPVCNGLNGIHNKDCRHVGDLPECDDGYTGAAGTTCKPKAALAQTRDVSVHQPAREVGLPVCNGLNGLDGRECRHDGPLPVCDGHFTGHPGVDCTVAPKSDALIMMDSAPALQAPLREIGLPICNGLNGLNGKECKSETVPTCNGHFTGHRGVDCVPEPVADI